MTVNDIPVGRQHAISKEELAARWGCSTREARRAIADFRADTAKAGDYCILSTSTGGGYWRSNDVEEISAFIKETESRARNTFLSRKTAREFLRRKGGEHQIHMDEIV